MPEGSMALLVDTGNHLIRSVDMGSREVRMFTGSGIYSWVEFGNTYSYFQPGFQDGPASSARFSYPTYIMVSVDVSKVFVVDGGYEGWGGPWGGSRIRVIDMTTRLVSTLAGPRNAHVFGFLSREEGQDGFGENARFAGDICGIVLSPDGTMFIVADALGGLNSLWGEQSSSCIQDPHGKHNNR